MRFTIQPEVFKELDITIGIISIKGLNNENENEEIEKLLTEISTLIKDTFSKDSIKTHCLISPWIAAKERYGSDAIKHYKTSIELLLYEVLESGKILSRNNLEDTCNFISLKYIVPIGTNDMNKIEGDIHIKLATGTEDFEEGLKKPKENELVYADESGVISRKLNWVQSSGTKINEKTTNALIHVDVLPPVTEEKLKEILEELTSLIKVACGGETTIHILSKENPTANL